MTDTLGTGMLYAFSVGMTFTASVTHYIDPVGWLFVGIGLFLFATIRDLYSRYGGSE